MSTASSFFLAVFHFFALVWATIHPEVNPNQHNVGFQQIAHAVRVEYRQNKAQKHLLSASTHAIDTGYWHTSGNLIVDERSQPVKIQGINWYGFETVRKVPGGLTLQDYRAILDTIHRSGFNAVRIPLSNDVVEHPVVPENIAFFNDHGAINQPLRNLNSMQILDCIIEYSRTIGLKVILDNHRSESGDSAEQTGLWYTNQFPESSWIADWQALARRYAGNSTVIGFDLRNEPHNAVSGGSCWSGCDAAHDWHRAAERAGNAVLAINPRLIVFVEGTDAVNNDFYWWGGNLQGVRHAPVRLNVPNQLVYSAHTYGPKEYQQKWFNASTTYASLEAVWNRHWAFISREGIAPVWIGEFGTTNNTEDIVGAAPGSQAQWFQSLVAFLGKNPEIGWTSWALNGEDADGLLSADYAAPANQLKLVALKNLMEKPAPAAPGGIMLTATNTLPAPMSYSKTNLYSNTDVVQQPYSKGGVVQPYRPHLPASVLRTQSASFAEYDPQEAHPHGANPGFEQADGDR